MSRIFRKYALLFGSFVSAALIVGALVEMYFSYQETKTELLNAQRQRAERAAEAIERFVGNLESQMGWTLHAAFLPRSQAIEQRRMDFTRLLKQVPAITQISYVDASGKEQLLTSRLSSDRVGGGKDYAEAPTFIEAAAKGRQDHLNPFVFQFLVQLVTVIRPIPNQILRLRLDHVKTNSTPPASLRGDSPYGC